MPYADKKKENKRACERYRRKSAARKAAGLCIHCGERPAEDGFFSCTACRERVYAYQEKRKERLLSTGRCVRCGKPNDDSTFQICFQCRFQYANNNAIRIAKLKESRRCIDCGVQLPDNYYYVSCELCREKKSWSARKEREAKKREAAQTQ